MKLKGLFAFLKKPPALFVVFVWVLTIAAVSAAIFFVVKDYSAWPAYVVYCFSASFLAYSVYLIVVLAPELKRKIVDNLSRNRFIGNMTASYGFRTVVIFAASFAVNLAFVIFNAVLGIMTASVFYGVIACYYLFLSALRGIVLLLSYKAKKRAGDNSDVLQEYKLKIYMLCGVLLFVLELALAAAVTLMVLYRKPVQFSQVMAIAAAAYTFYKVIFAIVNVFKVRSYHDPMLQCFRNINLTDAAVSLLSLQVTLVAVFSNGSAQTSAEINILNAITGFAVCALSAFIGGVMIAGGCKGLKKIKEGKNNVR